MINIKQEETYGIGTKLSQRSDSLINTKLAN